jgi:Tol biopolymer transport system component
MQKRFIFPSFNIMACFAIVIILAIPLNITSHSSSALTPVNTPVQLTSSGVYPNQDVTSQLASSNSRYIAFKSRATNLIASNDGNYHIFVLDTLTGAMTNETLGIARVEMFTMSRNGRFLLLRESNTPSRTIFIDRLLDETQVIGTGYYPVAVSEDGRTIIYRNGNTHYRMDRSTGISVQLPVGTANFSSAETRDTLSCDGRFVVGMSAAQLVPEDTDTLQDIYLLDFLYNSVKKITLNANEHSYNPEISCDGNYVTFLTHASNFDIDTNNNMDIYRYSLETEAVTRISLAPGESEFQGTMSYASEPETSADGRYVYFVISGGSLSSTYLRDTQTNTTTLVLGGQTYRPTLGYSPKTLYVTSGKYPGISRLQKVTNIIP